MDASEMNTLTYEETNELQDDPKLVFVHGADRFDVIFIGWNEHDEMEFKLVKRAR